jgi:hypothetical protein
LPAIDRPKNVKRALLLGDSVPFSGWGCREGGALRRTLELRTGEEWNVINTGTPAGFSSMALATLAHEGMQFKPDIVVSFNGANGGRQVSQRRGALHQDWISKGHSGFPSWNEIWPTIPMWPRPWPRESSRGFITSRPAAPKGVSRGCLRGGSRNHTSIGTAMCCKRSSAAISKLPDIEEVALLIPSAVPVPPSSTISVSDRGRCSAR